MDDFVKLHTVTFKVDQLYGRVDYDDDDDDDDDHHHHHDDHDDDHDEVDQLDWRADELNGQLEPVGCIWCSRASVFVWREI